MSDPRHVVRIDWDCPQCPWSVCTETVVFAESDVGMIINWVDLLIEKHVQAHAQYVEDVLESSTAADLIEHWSRQE